MRQFIIGLVAFAMVAVPAVLGGIAPATADTISAVLLSTSLAAAPIRTATSTPITVAGIARKPTATATATAPPIRKKRDDNLSHWCFPSVWCCWSGGYLPSVFMTMNGSCGNRINRLAVIPFDANLFGQFIKPLTEPVHRALGAHW
jgi:hypothetical protein